MTVVGGTLGATSPGPLGTRRFRLLLVARSVSLLGDYVVVVALAFAVLEMTGSAADLGLVLAAAEVPTIIFLLGGGVLADRLERRRLMIGADLTRLGTQGLLALLLVTGQAALWQVVVLQVARGAAVALFRPASSGILPQVVAREHLQRANSLLMFARTSGAIVGPALGGTLVALVGAGWAVGLDAASFAASAALLALIGPLPASRLVRRSALQDLAAGWREVWGRRWVFGCIANFSLFQLFTVSSWLVLGPAVANSSLGGAPAWGAIVATGGVGAMVGATLTFRLHLARPLRTAFLAMLVYPLLLVALALALPVPALALLAFAASAASVTADTLWFTALQQNLPEAVLSRVSSYDWLGTALFFPVGLTVVGPLASVLGIGPTLLASASLSAASTLLFLLTRIVHDPVPPAAAPAL